MGNKDSRGERFDENGERERTFVVLSDTTNLNVIVVIAHVALFCTGRQMRQAARAVLRTSRNEICQRWHSLVWMLHLLQARQNLRKIGIVIKVRLT